MKRNRCDHPDHMEMPCRCDCGKWIELEDMESPKGQDEPLLCPECLADWDDPDDDTLEIRKDNDRRYVAMLKQNAHEDRDPR